jgi:hypothetical protein
VTIDRMTLDGQTRLNVTKTGTLTCSANINQIQGWTNVDGRVQSGRDMMLLWGMLSGTGTVKAPFVTVVGAIVRRARGRIGTLTVDGEHDPRFGLVAVHRRNRAAPTSWR